MNFNDPPASATGYLSHHDLTMTSTTDTYDFNNLSVCRFLCPICDRVLLRADEMAYYFCPVHRLKVTDEALHAGSRVLRYRSESLRTGELSRTVYQWPMPNILLPFDLSADAANIAATRWSST
jgi:hypothetical protein